MAKIEEARERKISSESNTTPEKKVANTTAPSSDENKNNSNSRHDLFPFNSTIKTVFQLKLGNNREYILRSSCINLERSKSENTENVSKNSETDKKKEDFEIEDYVIIDSFSDCDPKVSWFGSVRHHYDSSSASNELIVTAFSSMLKIFDHPSCLLPY